MSVNYSTAVKNARLDAVAAQIDSGPAAGFIEICSAAYAAVLAVITLGDPCAAAASGGVLTFSGFPRSDTAADASGTAAIARIKNSTGTVMVDGLTVGAGTGDINLDSVSITAGQQVTLNSATITHAA